MEQVSLLDVVGRLLPSLFVVIGGLLLVKRLAAGKRGGLQKSMRVVGRVGLSRSASVAVVQVGDLHYLVGATEQNVNLLAELPEETVAQVLAGQALGAFGDLPQDAGVTGGRATQRNAVESPWTGLVQKAQEMTLRRGRDPGGTRAPR